MKILALDLASRVGWAHNCDPAGIRTGTKSFATPAAGSRARRSWSPGDRWVEFSAWLTALADRNRPELLVCEAPLVSAMRNADTAAVAFGMSTRVEELARSRGIALRVVHNATLKLWATGDGHADKPAMIAAAEARYGSAFLVHDEADASLLLAYALAGFPQPERRKKRKPSGSNPP